MRVPITVPDFHLGSEPLRLGAWTVDVGDAIDEGESLAELIWPGMAVDLPAPASGRIAELMTQPEQSVAAGEVLGWIETGPQESID